MQANERTQFLSIDDATAASLTEFVNLMSAAQDATSDEMVARLAYTFSEGMALLDRITRNEGLMRLVQVLADPDSQRLLVGIAEAIRATSRDLATATPARGGIRELLRLGREPGTQEGMRLLGTLGRHLSEGLRAQSRAPRSDGS